MVDRKEVLRLVLTGMSLMSAFVFAMAAIEGDLTRMAIAVTVGFVFTWALVRLAKGDNP